MTLYLVKHADSDYRLHLEDGTVIHTGTTRPDERAMVDWLAEYHNGASILGNPDARRHFTDIVTGAVNFRDLTVSEETVPWQ